MNAFRYFTRKLIAPLCAGLLAFAMTGIGAAAADGSEGPGGGDPSATRNPLTLIAQANCPRPYHVKTPDGRCVWSCSKGTTPDRASGECVCKQGLKETGKDRFGRRVCTAGQASDCKWPYHVRTNEGRCMWLCSRSTRADRASGECVCRRGLKETGKDRDGRRVCTRVQASDCKRPYHVRRRDGRCVWSCGQGTRPDRASGKCVCKKGYKAKARDRLGRLVCTRGRVGGKRKPDLIIRAFGLKSWGKCTPYSVVFTFQVTVANIGSQRSPAIPAKALVQAMDQHGNGWGQGKVLGSISPGGSITVLIPVAYLIGDPGHMTAAAPHPFRAIADPLGLVDELYESNNKSKIIKVGAPKGCVK